MPRTATDTPSEPRVNPWRVFRGAFIPNAVLALPCAVLSSDAKVCYSRLLQYAGRKGIAFPHVDTLAAEIGHGRDRAERSLRELRALGLISTRQRGRGRSSLVFFHLPAAVFGAVDNSKTTARVREQNRETTARVREQNGGALKGSRARPEEIHEEKRFTAPRGGAASRRNPVFAQQGNPSGQKRVLQLLGGIGKGI